MKQDRSAPPSMGMRVLQGIILGIVLAIPVVLWAYTKVHAGPENDQIQTATEAEKGVSRLPAAARRTGAPNTQTRKRPATPLTREVETIPASQMHLRIDTGARPASTPSMTQSIAAVNE